MHFRVHVSAVHIIGVHVCVSSCYQGILAIWQSEDKVTWCSLKMDVWPAAHDDDDAVLILLPVVVGHTGGLTTGGAGAADGPGQLSEKQQQPSGGEHEPSGI